MFLSFKKISTVIKYYSKGKSTVLKTSVSNSADSNFSSGSIPFFFPFVINNQSIITLVTIITTNKIPLSKTVTRNDSGMAKTIILKSILWGKRLRHCVFVFDYIKQPITEQISNRKKNIRISKTSHFTIADKSNIIPKTKI